MVRTLPWLAKADTSRSRPTTLTTSSRKRARERTPSQSRNHDVEISPETPSAASNDHNLPSSPPLDEPPPPEIEYMHEGFDADDRYRMVEDELYATAKTFTRHLHAHEYLQHKRRVRARGVDTINNMPRPTDGKTTQSSVIGIEKKIRVRAKKVNKALASLCSDDSATESDAESTDKHERAVTDSFAKFAAFKDYSDVDLGAVIRTKSNTLAAAGLRKSHAVRQNDRRPDDCQPADKRVPQLQASDDTVQEDDSDTRTTSLAGNAIMTYMKGSQKGKYNEPASSPSIGALNTTTEILDRSAASAFIARRKAALASKQKSLSTPTT